MHKQRKEGGSTRQQVEAISEKTKARVGDMLLFRILSVRECSRGQEYLNIYVCLLPCHPHRSTCGSFGDWCMDRDCGWNISTWHCANGNHPYSEVSGSSLTHSGTSRDTIIV